MVKEKLQVKSSANTHRKQLNVSFDSLDIVTLAKKMKHDCNWIQGDLSTKILLKNSTKKVLLTALHEGTEIKSYQSNDSITFQVIEGRLSFRTRKKCVVIEKDQLLTLKENIKLVRKILSSF